MREALRDAERTLAWLDQGLFRFRTPEAARILANALARACPYPEKTVLGLWELMINAVEHGNLGITYGEKSLLMTDGCWIDEVEARLALPEHRSKQVEVLFERDPTEITITIRDQGKGFDWRKYLELDPDRAFDPHGRGIAMARLISFRELEYLGSGDTVRVRITAADETG
jgi:anti-sigma regulatory factor (Ser/Thr protein kinase)